MKFSKTQFDRLGVAAEIATFAPHEGVREWHVMLHVEPRGELFEGQMERIYAAEDLLPGLPEFEGAHYVMKRYFVSDSTNQCPLMRNEADIAISMIQQQPLDGSKIAVWLYLVSKMEVSERDGMVVASHNGYNHLWKMAMHHNNGNSYTQTESVLIEYEDCLKRHGATLADNCIRTWFFVRDVDTQYSGMVKARLANFIEQGLTDKTHYIASTGIGALPADPRALVQLGAYAITGLKPGQQRYLYAPTHLNPTYEYGVTFERGTRVDFGDRRHVYISGTASINNKGEVVHVGNIVKQTERMWENVETLLREAETGYEDVMQIVVYLRDTADYAVVRDMFAERFPHIPTIIALAPVCRPAWLIEMECIAVKGANNPDYSNY